MNTEDLSRSTPRWPRGSEWRKWDLHVHTPYSALNNGYGVDMDNYTTQLLEAADREQIAAIGITDYFSVEGYKQLRARIDDSTRLNHLVSPTIAEASRRLLILPNIEFRTSVVVSRPGDQDSRVNFHVLFSDDLSAFEIDEYFLRELKFTALSSPDSADERWSVSQANLETLGRRLKEEHKDFRDKSDLYVGMMNAVVTHEDVTNVLSSQASRFKDKYLIVVPIDEDLSRINWNGQGHLTRKLFIQKAHMFFSANPGTREFALGRRHENAEHFQAEFGKPKPCIHGSDSHSYDKLFKPDLDRFLWLKGDPTFSGLRQLLNEPEDRVFIGKIPPGLISATSRPTKIVKQVSIRKIPGSTLTEKWFNCNIPLNPELVAIIGNKGNAKSALADVLGLLGGTPRSDSFSFLRDDRFRDVRGKKAHQFEAGITWADGTTEAWMSLADNPEPDAVKKIRYIPQNYLEAICNEVGLGKESSFYSELQNVIFSHVPQAERLGFDNLDDLLNNRSEEVEEAIEIFIDEIRQLNREIISIESKLSKKHRRSLELELQEKRRELMAHEQLRPADQPAPDEDVAAQEHAELISSQLSGKQIELEQVQDEIRRQEAEDARLAKRRSIANKLVTKLENLQRQVKTAMTEVSTDIKELGLVATDLLQLTLNLEPLKLLIGEIDGLRTTIAFQLDSELSGTLAEKESVAVLEIAQLREALSAPHREHQMYLQSLRDWEQRKLELLGSVEEPGTVKYYEHQLEELANLPVLLTKLCARRERKAMEILREKQRLREFYATYYGSVQRFLTEHELAATNNLAVTFDVTISEAGFVPDFLAHINQRKKGVFAGIDEGTKEAQSLTDATDWNSVRSTIRFTRSLFKKLTGSGSGSPDIATQLSQATSMQDLYDFVFSFNYLSPIYRLTWEGKGLEQLSPGERGNLLLLFYLVIDLDNIPLVIDQPEENLDNQTVVRTLVPCMRYAKRRRQIIMVTHNPNLAVVCDADQIVYSAIDKSNGNQVTYFTGSIEDFEVNAKLVDVLEGTRPAFDLREAKYKV